MKDFKPFEKNENNLLKSSHYCEEMERLRMYNNTLKLTIMFITSTVIKTLSETLKNQLFYLQIHQYLSAIKENDTNF